ncbi:MAG: CoA transferase, partial [Dehalococcoidia bacterium]|nr:CoA transferase [Dehalococcoidia bacterium]
MAAEPNDAKALGSLRVLDLGGLPTAYASRLLADFGADVVLIEPPGGDISRAMPPFAAGIEDGDHSLSFLALHTNKRSSVIDVRSDIGRSQLLELVRGADVLLESFAPGYLAGIGLSFADLHAANPRIVVCSVTPYGQTGPYAGYRGSDLHAEAMGGVMMLQGDPTKAPSMSPAFLGYSLAGVHAGLGIMHALFARE